MKRVAVSYIPPGMKQEKTEVLSGKSTAGVLARLREEYPTWELREITEKGGTRDEN